MSRFRCSGYWYKKLLLYLVNFVKVQVSCTVGLINRLIYFILKILNYFFTFNHLGNKNKLVLF